MVVLRSKDSARFYLYATLFLLSGWLWLLWSLSGYQHNGFTVCFIKNTTGIPCPACGSTTSLVQIIKGNWWIALYTNPLGYIIATGLVAGPLWLVADLLTGKSTMHHALYRFDRAFRRRPLLLLVVLLPLLFNWIWNIMKM